MRKWLIAVIIGSFIFTGCVGPVLSLAGNIGNSVGGGNDTPASVLATSMVVIGSVTAANIAFLESLANLEEATGNRQKAATLRATMRNLKAKPADLDMNKQAVAAIEDATTELQAVDFETKINAKKSKTAISKSILFMGGGALADGVALGGTTKIIFTATKIVANPAKAASPEVVKLGTVLLTMKFIVTQVPGQVTAIKGISSKVQEYAKAHDISTPSSNEILAYSKSMVKG